MSLDGTKDLERRFSALESVVENSLQSQTHEKGLHVQSVARERCPERRYGSGGGGLRQSIHVSTEMSGDTAISTVYTNSEYAPYVEFGTGPVGQDNHEGISPDVVPAYNQGGWMMPAGAMTAEAAERYGLGIVRGKGGRIVGYLTNGQPAQPFMYPALRDSRDTVLKDLKTDFIANIKKVTK